MIGPSIYCSLTGRNVGLDVPAHVEIQGGNLGSFLERAIRRISHGGQGSFEATRLDADRFLVSGVDMLLLLGVPADHSRLWRFSRRLLRHFSARKARPSRSTHFRVRLSIAFANIEILCSESEADALPAPGPYPRAPLIRFQLASCALQVRINSCLTRSERLLRYCTP